jgi:tetratricopeptide (TPR) repeat protein
MKRNIDSTFKFHLIVAFSIALLCIIIYSNTLNSPFVFDDFPNIKENHYFRLIDPDFQKLYDAGFKSPNPNRPVANISFALNYYFGKYDVKGYHIVNITIHIINGILVYLLALIIFQQASNLPNQKIPQLKGASIPLISLFATLVFISHPVQTQSVTYIVQRMNSMSAMFYLMSLLLYINGRLTRVKWKQWALFFGCFVSWVMALGSKEIASTLPFIILLYEWYFFQDLGSNWLRKNIKYFFGLFAVLGLAVLIYLGWSPFNKILAAYAYRDFTMTQRVLTQFRIVVLYISLLFYPYPSRLNLLHHITTSNSLLEPITTLLSLLSIVGLIGLAFYIARRQRLISFCILWFIINLVIESSVIGLEMIYEHRLYLPMLGFALIVSCLLFHFLSKQRLWAIVVSAVIILFLCTGTYVRNRMWRDSITLWSDVLSKNPQSQRAHSNLGNVLVKQKRFTEAIRHYSEALRIKPDYAKAHYNLGNAMEHQGRLNEAIKHFSEAIRIKPNYTKAHNNMGIALSRQGRFDEAIEHFTETLRLKPDHARAYNNMGIAFARQGRLNEAIGCFSEALKITPHFANAHNNLGNALKKQGRLEEAIRHFSEALRINPGYATTHYNLGEALDKQGRLNEAIRHYSEAIRLKPDYAKAHYNLGVAFQRQGKINEANVHFSYARRLSP